jgi:glycosyltransferase involved in cell wall biosynthesis
MNILIISDIPPYVNGGAETQARMLAEEFVKRGHTASILGHSVETTTLHYAGRDIQVRKIRIIRQMKALRAVSYIFSLSTYLLTHRQQFDIVYCRFVREATLTVSFLKYLFRLKLPLVGCTASIGKIGDAEYIRSLPFSNFIVSVLNKHCNYINNISPATEHELRALGINPASLTLIPNGIRFLNIGPKDYVNKKRQIVFLGRLSPEKGLEYLLQAFRQVLDSGIDCSLHIIGDGPQKDNLFKQCEELLLNNRVTFYGHIENNKIINTLKQFDIFVMPSLYEGFCTAIIEAMFAGLPVIATRSGGPEFFVEQQVGRICDTANAMQLAANMLDLLQRDDSELLSIGRRGRNKVINKFDINSVAEQYLDLFKTLL